MLQFDTLIIGSGLAGLALAIKLADRRKVGLITKKSLLDGASGQAQGGIAQGDVTANLGTAKAGTFTNQAQLNAEGQQAQNNSIGSLLGAGLGMFNFGFGGGSGTATA